MLTCTLNKKIWNMSFSAYQVNMKLIPVPLYLMFYSHLNKSNKTEKVPYRIVCLCYYRILRKFNITPSEDYYKVSLFLTLTTPSCCKNVIPFIKYVLFMIINSTKVPCNCRVNIWCLFLYLYLHSYHKLKMPLKSSTASNQKSSVFNNHGYLLFILHII